MVPPPAVYPTAPNDLMTEDWGKSFRKLWRIDLRSNQSVLSMCSENRSTAYHDLFRQTELVHSITKPTVDPNN